MCFLSVLVLFIVVTSSFFAVAYKVNTVKSPVTNDMNQRFLQHLFVFLLTSGTNVNDAVSAGKELSRMAAISFGGCTAEICTLLSALFLLNLQ